MPYTDIVAFVFLLLSGGLALVSAIPLYRRAGGGSQLRVILAIDFLESGHFHDMEAAVEDPAFASVIGFCESAL